MSSRVNLDDHLRQMRQEEPEAICRQSSTERHVFQLTYDTLGRPNYSKGDVVACEACGRYITQAGARWVLEYPDDHPVAKEFQKMGQFIIQEQDSIEDVL